MQTTELYGKEVLIPDLPIELDKRIGKLEDQFGIIIGKLNEIIEVVNKLCKK